MSAITGIKSEYSWNEMDRPTVPIHFNEYPILFKKYLDYLFRLPKALELINEVKKQGPISLMIVDKCNEYGAEASWSWKERIVKLAIDGQTITKIVILSVFHILFELHNAKNTLKFVSLHHKVIQNRISKGDYIEAIERIEYQNGVDTKKLIDEGIEKGFYTSATKIPALPPFEEQLLFHMLIGHYQHYVPMYEEFCAIGASLRWWYTQQTNLPLRSRSLLMNQIFGILERIQGDFA